MLDLLELGVVVASRCFCVRGHLLLLILAKKSQTCVLANKFKWASRSASAIFQFLLGIETVFLPAL